ncbi:hypothetical protein LTR66_005745 [Elasticomyces elasticus]|nr:hypothetical protein LTR66_005745 [Elasticomyces elasticus]
MSATQRLPFVVGVLSSGGTFVALTSLPAARKFFYRYLGISAPGGIWRVLAVLFAILNFKSLPFVWHMRVLRGIFYHLKLNPHSLTPDALFTPIITSTHTPLMECDYNLHKSNSTYFSDFDASRGQHVACLLRVGMSRLNNGDITGLPVEAVKGEGRFIIALGGVACVFRKEVAPFEKVEIWTRLLSWDGKWLYLVSHMVKKGLFKPSSYALQPWKKRRVKLDVQTEEDEKTEQERLKRAIFASSIAKYVVKKGRLTIAPEVVLERSNLLPPRPSSVHTPAVSAAPVTQRPSSSEDMDSELNANPIDEVVRRNPEADWTWEDMERVRRKGLHLAQIFDGLGGLHDVFDGGKDGAMGEYADLFW